MLSKVDCWRVHMYQQGEALPLAQYDKNHGILFWKIVYFLQKEQDFASLYVRRQYHLNKSFFFFTKEAAVVKSLQALKQTKQK